LKCLTTNEAPSQPFTLSLLSIFMPTGFVLVGIEIITLKIIVITKTTTTMIILTFVSDILLAITTKLELVAAARWQH